MENIINHDLNSITSLDRESLMKLCADFGLKLEFGSKYDKETVSLVKESNRYKIGYKVIFNYFIPSDFSRITSLIQKELIDIQSIAKYKKSRKDEANSVGNPYKVGDILHECWGVEQTNNDFYQVVEVKDKTLVLLPIGKVTVKEITDMSNYIKAVPNKFISTDRITKRLSKIITNGYPIIKMSSYSHASYVDNIDEVFYESSYA